MDTKQACHQDQIPGHPEPSRRRRRAWGLRLSLLSFVAAIFAALSAPTASADPWPCDGVGYITQFGAGGGTGGNTLFLRADRQPDDSYTFTQLGSIAGTHVNALAFRPHDGFMYAFDHALQRILRIETDGSGNATFTTLDPAVGMPAGTFTTVIGTVLADGRYFMWGTVDGVDAQGLIVDVSDPTTPVVDEVITQGTALLGSDWAVSPVDGQLYTSRPDGIFKVGIDLGAGALTNDGRVGDGVTAGAQWFLPDGRLIAYNNSAGTIWAADVASGTLTQLGTAPAISNVDGASCANGLALTKDASPRTVTAGEQLTYTYEFTSRGLTDSQVDFADQLPAGMTYVANGVSVSPPSFGTPNDYAGTDTLEISGTVSPNETVTITATVQVTPDADCGATVDNQAQAALSVAGLPGVIVDSDDPATPADPDDPTTVEVICESDLALAKSAPATVFAGEQITWTLTVTNNGPSASPGATVTDQIPAGITDAATSTPGCSIAGGAVTCDIGPLGVGESTEILVTATAPTPTGGCDASAITNEATVTGAEEDPDASNNSAQATTCPVLAEVTIEKRGPEKPVGIGQKVNYRLVVTNNGPSEATDVVVEDAVPAALDVRGASTPQGSCEVDGNEVSCALGTLAVGQQVTVKVRAVAKRAGKATNSATVTSEQCLTTPCDEDPHVVKIRKPRIEIAKSARPKQVTAGEEVVWTIRVRNTGRVPAFKLRVCDNLPEQITPTSLGGGKLAKGKLCWRINRLNPKQGKRFRFRARVDADANSGRVRNTATVRGAGGLRGRDRDRVRVQAALGAGERQSRVTG